MEGRGRLLEDTCFNQKPSSPPTPLTVPKPNQSLRSLFQTLRFTTQHLNLTVLTVLTVLAVLTVSALITRLGSLFAQTEDRQGRGRKRPCCRCRSYAAHLPCIMYSLNVTVSGKMEPPMTCTVAKLKTILGRKTCLSFFTGIAKSVVRPTAVRSAYQKTKPSHGKYQTTPETQGNSGQNGPRKARLSPSSGPITTA